MVVVVEGKASAMVWVWFECVPKGARGLVLREVVLRWWKLQKVGA
jgi:hypothetical protein